MIPTDLRYSSAAKRVMRLAQQQAEIYRFPATSQKYLLLIEPEHLLLAFLLDGSNTAAKVLRRLGFNAFEAERAVGLLADPSTIMSPPYRPRLYQALILGGQ